MSDRNPHVTDIELGVIASRAVTDWELMTMVRDEYEAKVVKDAELIQRLVDAIMDNARYRLLTEGEEGDTVSDFMNMTLNEALAAADAEGFKPTEQ